MSAPHHTMYGPARESREQAANDQNRMAREHGGSWALVFNTRHGVWYAQLTQIPLESFERSDGCLYMRAREEAHPELFGVRGFLSRLTMRVGL